MAALNRPGKTPATAFRRLPPFIARHGDGLCCLPSLSTAPPAWPCLKAPSAPGLSGAAWSGQGGCEGALKPGEGPRKEQGAGVQ